MAEEFLIVEGTRCGGAIRMLIAAEEVANGTPLADFFHPDTIDIGEIGRIQICGDTQLLGTVYAEEL